MTILRNSLVQALILLAIALLLRAYTFGDPNLFIDEAFYFAAGNAMHHGALPYVDIWDRKPFGLFLIYYLVAGISANPAAYQIAATICAALTGLVISRIASLWADGPGGLLAGIAYLFLISAFQGFGGQSPVFYNLFVALAALLVARSLPRLREGRITAQVYLAMLAAGFALTVKTTALFEAAFLGLCAVFALPPKARASGAVRLALVGALPAMAIMAFYALIGHFAVYWQAMTGANLSASRWDALTAQYRLRIMFHDLAPLLVLSAFGWLDMAREARRFTGIWIVAAIAGLAAFPYFHLHYALPLLVPLCVAAGAFLSRRWIGPAAALLLCAWEFATAPPIDRARTLESRAAMERIAAAITAHSGGRSLLVYQGPPFLYTLTGQPFPSPLAFPAHLNHLIEKNVSHLDTLAEVNRVIAARPGAVVMTRVPRDGPLNTRTYGVVAAYVRVHCQLVAQAEVPERLREDQVLVWGDCR